MQKDDQERLRILEISEKISIEFLTEEKYFTVCEFLSEKLALLERHSYKIVHRLDTLEQVWPDFKTFSSPDYLRILPDLVTKSLNLVTLEQLFQSDQI